MITRKKNTCYPFSSCGKSPSGVKNVVEINDSFFLIVTDTCEERKA